MRHQKAGPRSHPKTAGEDRRKKSPDLGTIRQLAEAWAEARGHNAETPARQLIAIAGTLTPHQLTENHLAALHARWKLRLRPSTLYTYATELRAFLRQHGLPKFPRVRKPNPRTVIAAPDEITKLLDAAPPWQRVLILIGAHAGLRISDAMRIAPAHRAADGNSITIAQKKGGDPVTIPLTADLRSMLDKAPDGLPATPYYALYKGKSISSSAATKAWWRLKDKAHVNRDLWFHDLRRTVAVALYEISKDLRVVEQLLGHRSLTSTVRYLEHRDPGKLKPYLQALYTPKGSKETVQ